LLVVDAGVALRVAISGPGPLVGERLAAPPFMWAEARSGLHEAAWRGEVAVDDAEAALAELDRLPVESRSPRRLGRVAWQLADELGWAKTYDAEYLALAQLLRCRVVTVDSRLRRGADRLNLVVLPSEL
jgi:predicted nucleic acid-binding protein